MIRNISVGIDVGTHTTRVVVSEFFKNDPIPHIVGTGFSQSSGLRHGYITNIHLASESIKSAVIEAEKSSHIKIKRAFVSVGGVSLESVVSSGSTIISRADTEVTSIDIKKVIQNSNENLNIQNRKIIDTIPLFYKLDGKEVLGNPLGMKGIKLEVKTLFVICLSQHIEDLVSAVAEAGIETIDVIASPIAASAIVLQDRQKIAGCVLVNIGAETVSIAVFENSILVSLHIFSIGSTDITNDIALGLKIPLEEAENVKIGVTNYNNYSKKKVDEIIEARLSDIFELIEKHLKKMNRSGLLPAGAIITGGGSSINDIEEISKGMLRLPSRLGYPECYRDEKIKPKDSSWFVAIGLCIAGKNSVQNEMTEHTLGNTIKNIKKIISGMIRQVLP